MSGIESSYQPALIIVGSIIGSVTTVGTLISRRIGRQDEELRKLRELVFEETKQRTILSTQFNLFWDYYKKEVPKVLMRPHTPEIDAYLKKIERNEELTDDEKRDFVKRMRDVLEEGYDSRYDINRDVKGVYAFLIAHFESQLKTDEKVREIEKHYDEKLQQEREKHHEKSRWKFW